MTLHIRPKSSDCAFYKQVNFTACQLYSPNASRKRKYNFHTNRDFKHEFVKNGMFSSLAVQPQSTPWEPVLAEDKRHGSESVNPAASWGFRGLFPWIAHSPVQQWWPSVPSLLRQLPTSATLAQNELHTCISSLSSRIPEAGPIKKTILFQQLTKGHLNFLSLPSPPYPLQIPNASVSSDALLFLP